MATVEHIAAHGYQFGIRYIHYNNVKTLPSRTIRERVSFALAEIIEVATILRECDIRTRKGALVRRRVTLALSRETIKLISIKSKRIIENGA